MNFLLSRPFPVAPGLPVVSFLISSGASWSFRGPFLAILRQHSFEFEKEFAEVSDHCIAHSQMAMGYEERGSGTADLVELTMTPGRLRKECKHRGDGEAAGFPLVI